jgi:hypothetical protein
VPESEQLDVSEAELENMVVAFASQTADEQLEAEARFARSVARLIRDRQNIWTGAMDPSSPAVFLLAPNAKDATQSFTHVPFLTYQKTQLSGRVWLSNEVAATGRFLDHTLSDDELVAFVVETLGMGNVPAVVFDPASVGQEIRLYARGLSDLEYPEISPLVSADVTPAQIEAIIGKWVSAIGFRPGLSSRKNSPWKNGRLRHAASDAELAIQAQLHVGLSCALLDCDITIEKDGKHGRRDITIHQYVEGIKATLAHCVLELKVLRGLDSSGNAVSQTVNRNAIAKGLVQAYKYRLDERARWSALICFDLRQADCGNEDCFDKVKSRAIEWNVHTKRYYLYGSADEARAASA